MRRRRSWVVRWWMCEEWLDLLRSRLKVTSSGRDSWVGLGGGIVISYESGSTVSFLPNN